MAFYPCWQAKVIYRTDRGPVDVLHDLEEIGDLGALIEAGPHWDTIVKIEINRVNHCDGSSLTIEQAATL